MIIAITGGIGCGKSVVSQLLRIMGYQVYDCDKEAKQLMVTDSELRTQLCALFGPDTYLPNGSLNRPYLAAQIFADNTKKEAMNAIVHPFVARDILTHYEQHKAAHGASSPFFFESAILFEAGFNQLVHPHHIWSVSAPLQLRIGRTLLRDSSTLQQVQARINNQMPQEEKDQKADAVILNDSTHSIIHQVNLLLKAL